MKMWSLLVFAGICPVSVLAKPTEVQRWSFYMAHNAVNVKNRQVLEEFASKVDQRTQGKLKISIFSQGKNVDHDLALAEVLKGEKQMTQVGTNSLYKVDRRFELFDLPYVFRGHDHVAAVVDGDVGADLMKGLLDSTKGKIRGLAMTYSGGFRIIGSTKPYTKPSDFLGMRYPTYGQSQTRLAFQKALGAKAVVKKRDTTEIKQAMAAKEIDFFENHSTPFAFPTEQLPFFKSIYPVISLTRHTVFLTAIVVNERALAALSPEVRDVFLQEVNQLAKSERELSIQQDRNAEEILRKNGFQLVEPTPDDLNALKEVAKPVVEALRTRLSGNWVRRIEAL